MAFSKVARPTQNFTKTAKPLGGRAARYSVARFGQARYGRGDEWDRTVRPNQNFSKVART